MFDLEDKMEEEKPQEVISEEETNQVDEDHEEIVVEDNKSKGKKKNNKKPSKIKGAFSELKKVTWPTFGRVVKETLVVLSVTLVFLIVVIGIDQLLYFLFSLLTGKGV